MCVDERFAGGEFIQVETFKVNRGEGGDFLSILHLIDLEISGSSEGFQPLALFIVIPGYLITDGDGGDMVPLVGHFSSQEGINKGRKNHHNRAGQCGVCPSGNELDLIGVI